MSAKRVECDNEFPLASYTRTGSIIQQIEDKLDGLCCYKTNLVKCLPLDNDDKLRYPSLKEMNCCIENLRIEIDYLKPNVVFLLGQKVSNCVLSNLEQKEHYNHENFDYFESNHIFYVPIWHPSYVYVYKRKEILNYVSNVVKIAMYLS